MKYFSNCDLSEQPWPLPNIPLTLDALRGPDAWGRGGDFFAKPQGNDYTHSGHRAKGSAEDRNPKLKGKVDAKKRKG